MLPVIGKLEKKDKQLYMGLSAIDFLTGILNRRAFQKSVEDEMYKRRRGFSFLLMWIISKAITIHMDIIMETSA